MKRIKSDISYLKKNEEANFPTKTDYQIELENKI